MAEGKVPSFCKEIAKQIVNFLDFLLPSKALSAIIVQIIGRLYGFAGNAAIMTQKRGRCVYDSDARNVPISGQHAVVRLLGYCIGGISDV